MRRKKIGLGKDVLLFQREPARIRPVFVEAGTSDLMWDGRYYLWFPTPLSDGVWITPRGTCGGTDQGSAEGNPQGSLSSPVVHSSLQISEAGVASLSLNVPPPLSVLWLGHHLWWE